MASTGFSDIIRKSPFGPIKAHMEVSKKSTEELINFLESAVNSDWNKATDSRKVISQLENEADVLKAETRSLLTKSLFLAVPREDILDLIKLADDIPNTVKDISGLEEIPTEIDGCSAPTPFMTLQTIANLFQVLAAGIQPELKRVFNAMSSFPEMVGGTGHFDSLFFQNI